MLPLVVTMHVMSTTLIVRSNLILAVTGVYGGGGEGWIKVVGRGFPGSQDLLFPTRVGFGQHIRGTSPSNQDTNDCSGRRSIWKC